MSDTTPEKELAAFNQLVSLLTPFAEDVQLRLIRNVANWLQLDLIPAALSPLAVFPTSGVAPTGTPSLIDAPERSVSGPAFSGHEDITPKGFLVEKAPRTDNERIACLAFYLTHYRNQKHFKTFDLSKLNTEAAQPKFANAANSVKHATTRRFLVGAGKGLKQLGVLGEQFVLALPNREAANEAIRRLKPRRRTRTKAKARKTAKGQHGKDKTP